ncbi:hypothetical protein ACC675_37760, partial [Rhizobium ruizarguesonis]
YQPFGEELVQLDADLFLPVISKTGHQLVKRDDLAASREDLERADISGRAAARADGHPSRSGVKTSEGHHHDGLIAKSDFG